MSDKAPEVKIVLTAEDRGVAAAIKELGVQLTALKQKQQETADSALNLASAFKTMIEAAVVLKMVEFGKEVFNTTVSIERMSQRTGISAGMLSVFGKAAEQSGASTEQVNTSLGRLATNITKFQQGSTGAAAAFKALKIEQADFKNLSPDEKIRLVIERLGGMRVELIKNATAQALLGKGGAVLIPTLAALAGDGFDKVTEAAKRSGQYLTNDMAAAAARAAVAMSELEGVAKGMATQFEAGLLPAITDVADALTQDIEEGGTSSFKKLGEQAGEAIRYIVLAWTIGANTIGAIVASLLDIVHGVLNQIANAEITIFQAGDAAVHGHFKAAGQAIADGFHTGIQLAKDDVHELGSEWTALADIVTKQSATLFPASEKAPPSAPKPPGDGEPNPEDEKADKAKLAAKLAALQNELAFDKAKNAAEESLNQIAYNQGLESVRAFYAKKKALAAAESAEHIQILKTERDLTAAAAKDLDPDSEEGIKGEQKLAKLKSEIAIEGINAKKAQALLDSQLFLAEEAHQKTLQGYEAQLLKAQGLTYEAAVAQIRGEAAEVEIALAQAGLSGPALAAKLAQIQQLKLATAASDEDKKKGEEALRSLSNARDDINLRVKAGLDTQYGAEQKIAQLELSRIPALQVIAEQMRHDAVSPEQVQAAEDFSRKVRDIQVSAQAAANQMRAFGLQARTAIQGDLNTFLSTTILTARSVGDAFRQLAASVVGSIQKIVTQLIIQIAFQKILKALTSESGGGGGGGFAGMLGGFAALAEGGPVRGPGSSTSDSIPARLSDGEFVVRASAVRAVGVHTLAAINRGLTVPAITGLSIPRFAEGGLVQAGGGEGGDIRLGIGLDEGLVLRHLSSKGAARIILQHLSNNPKAAGKAISRGQ